MIEIMKGAGIMLLLTLVIGGVVILIDMLIDLVG